MGELLGVFDYVLSCSFKSPHGYACMEHISKLDEIGELILTPFKSPHGYVWLEDAWNSFLIKIGNTTNLI